MKKNGRRKKRIRWDHIAVWMVAIVFTAAAVYLLLSIIPDNDTQVDLLLDDNTTIHIQTETDPPHVNVVPKPEIDEQLLTVNDYSRPGTNVDAVEYIVIHYLGNPKTSAQENRDYFESLKDLQNVSMSSNFVIGVDGEIIECVPPGEIAYASNEMNSKSVSVENCHLDDTGRFTEDTYASCVRLVAWLVEEYELERESIIRHYDVTGKECPLYYVENEDKWEAFRDDVMAYIKECKKKAE